VTQSGDGLDGRPDQVVGHGPWYNQAIPGKSRGAVEIRASGHGSEEGEDNITFPERRTRGPRWSLLREPEAGRVPERAGGVRMRDISDEGHVKPGGLGGDTDLAFNLGGSVGRARLMETHLGLKPDWGKLNVRNFREGAGNVIRGAGLRPTAKAVDMPPDPTVGAPALYPAGPAVRQRLRQHGRQGRPDNGVHQSAGPEAEDLRQGEG
jgi:hypothetical protein